ncbi:MAG: LysE family translocator [Actinomycetes bacterium]
MLPTTHLLAFAITTLVLIVIPGPSVLFTVGRALSVGRRAALLTVVGNAAGAYLQVVAVAVGLGALVADSIAVFTMVKLAGAAYLVYLGVQAIRHRRVRGDAHAGDVVHTRTRRVLRDGFVVGLTNPKMIVFLAAALPQFVDRAAGQVTLQMLVLGLLVPAIALVSDSVWALAAGTARDWFARSPRRVERLSAAGGVSMVAVGASLAVTGRTD